MEVSAFLTLVIIVEMVAITKNDSFYRTVEVYKVVVIYYVETSQFFYRRQ